MKPRPALSKVASSMETIVMHGIVAAGCRSKAVRKSESDVLAEHAIHARDLVALCARNPQLVGWIRDGVEVAPVAAIHSAARQIAEEGGE